MARASVASRRIDRRAGNARSAECGLVAALIGTPGPDPLIGTPFADRLNGLGGSDLLVGARERDVLTGGGGDDRIAAAQDGATDTIRCGPGRDIVTAESLDRVAPDCEVLHLQLSRDLLFDPDAQHRTEVEPDSFADGSTLVTAFQSGRYIDAGAAAIGWATSHDAGRTWRSGFLPHLSSWSSPSGVYDRVADPVVARDAAHRLWLIASIGSKEGAARLLVSRSPDGIAWSAPVTVGREDSSGIDKEWVSCDNWPLSRFRGRCYLSYLDEDSRRIATRSSSDGGLTWSSLYSQRCPSRSRTPTEPSRSSARTEASSSSTPSRTPASTTATSQPCARSTAARRSVRRPAWRRSRRRA